MAELRVKETGKIKLFESDNTSSVTIASPASLGADRTITLPDASVTLVSGTMNDATALSGNIPVANLNSGTSASRSTFWRGDGAWATAGGGLVLQSQSAVSTSRTSITSTTFVSFGLSDTITCASTNSKVLVMVSGNYNCDSANAAVTYTTVGFQLTRNHSGISETEIFETRAMHNRPEDSGMDMIFSDTLSIIYLDSPSSTNELTYSLNGLIDPATSNAEMTAGGSGQFYKTMTLIELSE